MTFTYSERLKGSPLRGGPYCGMSMGECGTDGVDTACLVSTTLASVVFATISVQGNTAVQSSAAVASISTNGMIALSFGAACSGSWLAFGN